MNKTYKSRLDFLEAQMLKAMSAAMPLLSKTDFDLVFAGALADKDISSSFLVIANSKKIGQNFKTFIVNKEWLKDSDLTVHEDQMVFIYRGTNCTIERYTADHLELKLITEDTDAHILIQEAPVEEVRIKYLRLGGSGKPVSELKGKAKTKEKKVLADLETWKEQYRGYNKTPN